MKKQSFKALFLSACMIFAGSAAMAQIAHGGSPVMNQNAAKSAVPVAQLPIVDHNPLLQDDALQVKGGTPMRVGVMQQTKVSNFADGVVTTLDDGSRVWRTAISSPGANFMTLYFSKFDIPEGARLFVYNADGSFVLGSFVRENVLEGGVFYTQAIPGDVCYVEYIEPANVAGMGTLEITDVCHGYKPIFGSLDPKGQLGDAEGSCHINVKCPEGDDWRDQIRSVVAINTVAGGYSFMCSGALINNTAQDRTPYVLSAFHCQDLSEYGPITQWTTYFNYQTNTCNGSSGPCNKSVTGATIVAKNSYSTGSDFMLLRLASNVPESYKAYYAGWDRNNVASPTPGSCIHHPGGDYKKISIPSVITRLTGTYLRYYQVNWYTGANNKGVTEQGSSGSPLFNGDGLIIGQLYAGSSACNAMDGYDLYGRFYSSWNGDNSSTTRLSDWLDPANTGVKTLEGLNYSDVNIRDVAEVQTMSLYPNPTNGMVYLDIPDLGDASYKVFDLQGRCVLEGNTVLTATIQGINLGNLPAGAYRLQVIAGSRIYGNTVLIGK